MWFHTYTYAIYLLTVMGLYACLRPRGRQYMLLAASYLFYCWEIPWYGILLLVSTGVDYAMGLWIGTTEKLWRRKAGLACSLVINLGLLGYYKYADFCCENLCGLARLFGSSATWDPLGFVLPAGISFYTFQTISYTFQVYRRQYPAERDFIRFALYCSFFPQLVAGPIERATHLMPQLGATRSLCFENVRAGLVRILIGLFRKLVVADRFSIVADGVFSNPESCSPGVAWLGLACFCGQIYFDFAGYADMAIGSARIFGVELTENFRRPIMSVNIGEYWNRWHITLSGWFRDYLFNALGGFRRGNGRAMMNAFLVMFLCGLWHGARWNFAIWGLWNAFLLCSYYALRAVWRDRSTSLFWRIGGHALIFFLSMISALFFRAPDLATIGAMARTLVGLGASTAFPVYLWISVLMIVAWYLVEYADEHLGLRERWGRLPESLRAAGWALLLVAVALGAVNLQTPYLYFQF